MGLGGYTWTAFLRDGREIHQYLPDSTEISVDALRGEDVAVIRLYPTTERHVRIFLEVQPGEQWIKHWTRFVSLGVDGESEETPPVDVVGLVSDAPDGVRLFILHDGTIMVSTRKVV